MNKYVFDTSSFIVLVNNYYESRFPSLWDKFNVMVGEEKIVTVREVINEFESYQGSKKLADWSKEYSSIFREPNENEIKHLHSIFQVKGFQYIVSRQNLLQGKPVADPFIVAKAIELGACVVTEEAYKHDGTKIPNVCERFNVDCSNLEGFMHKENWLF